MNAFKFNHLPGAIGPVIDRKGQSFLYFGGTAYLGMPQNILFRDYYIEGLKLYGINNGTSRNNNVQLGIYDQAEQVAAKRFGAEAALIISSGYLAAQLAVRHFADWGHVIYAPATHPALWQHGNPQVTGSFGYWSRHVVDVINQSETDRFVLVSNSMNNLFPEIYDFGFLSGVLPGKEVLLLVDDSHGLGMLNGGLGSYCCLPQLPNVRVLVMASMAKALGVDAGLILGDQQLISILKQSPVFLGASPPAAAGLYAFIKSEMLYIMELERLKDLCRYFSAGLGQQKSAFAALEGFPVYLSENQNLGKTLKDQQVLISSFAYPDQHGEILNRIVISSWHREQHLDLLLKRIHTGE
ncbi:aminotransferase class I/II-fold pyridoxal phosphate-dependent enzyme [Pedobacter sp.]|uniref:aminotransferase class I/II-fold pyridoxal phosphate-dependent enzyme n=1 Tax=Pedobacter sp. TaxID=1411316 RepID=UPI003D7F91E6